ncbi:MAG: glycosyltransferase [Candidatus Tectomicrobia bacterium]|uniref:Glycosyltransferase n=1 Tax=Tectimicrobiota bacterium TaxID=2528274 RepID=A0A938B2T6_UNCTE|nr:glycosyltransferase [Candidatus Tectomicrobia bacterium]
MKQQTTVADMGLRSHPEPSCPQPKRMVVLHLLHTVAYGGVETMILNWVRSMDQRRFDVRLACFANPGGGGTEVPFIEAAARLGFEVATLPWSRRKPLLKSARVLAQLLRQHQVDILHLHNCYADCVGVIAARLVPVQTISTVSVWSQLNWKRKLIEAVNVLALRFVDQVTVHCEETLRQTIARGFPAAHLKTLICGFDTHVVDLPPSERRRRRRALGIADEQLVLVNLARLYPEKLQATLLQCFQDIVLHCPQARLWIIGRGPLEGSLKALCTQLGLDHAVTFFDWVDDLPTMLSLADIQMHPSRMEGVSLSIGEGMAAGLPIVASHVGGMAEIIQHGHTGLLVPPDDTRGFVDTVLALLRQPDERQRLGAAARHFITHDYSLATAVARLEQTYEELLRKTTVHTQ